MDVGDFLELSPVPGVMADFTGYPDAVTFLSWVTTSSEEPELVTGFFQDNVRAYLGDNAVNQSMLETLLTPEGRREFHLRNNGVTIVARRADRRGTDLHLSYPQIVNGCQTTHVLFDVLRQLPPADRTSIRVPVRLIASEDDAIVNGVILGRNRQSPVDDFHILGRRPEVIRVGQFFALKYREERESNRMWFERRAREHRTNRNPARVMSLQDVAHAVLSAFGPRPHGITRAQLLDAAMRGALFRRGEPVMFYYLAALALLRLRYEYEMNVWKGFGAKQQALYAFRLILDRLVDKAAPYRNSYESRGYLDAIAPIVLDAPRAVKIARAVRSVITVAEGSACDATGNPLRGSLSRKARLEPFSVAVEQQVAILPLDDFSAAV